MYIINIDLYYGNTNEYIDIHSNDGTVTPWCHHVNKGLHNLIDVWHVATIINLDMLFEQRTNQ